MTTKNFDNFILENIRNSSDDFISKIRDTTTWGFDVDGVVINSNKVTISNLNKVFIYLGQVNPDYIKDPRDLSWDEDRVWEQYYKQPTKEFFKLKYGDQIFEDKGRKLLKQDGTPKTIAEVATEMYRKLGESKETIEALEIMPGIDKVIEELYKKNATIFFLSNKEQGRLVPQVMNILRRTLSKEIVSTIDINGTVEGRSAKPYTTSLLFPLKKAGFRSILHDNNFFYVGDSIDNDMGIVHDMGGIPVVFGKRAFDILNSSERVTANVGKTKLDVTEKPMIVAKDHEILMELVNMTRDNPIRRLLSAPSYARL